MQVSVAPAGVVIARLIELVAAVTVLLAVSWIVTTGWTPQAVPPVPPPGWVVNASLVPVPLVIANGPLVAAVGPPGGLEAVRV